MGVQLSDLHRPYPLDRGAFARGRIPNGLWKSLLRKRLSQHRYTAAEGFSLCRPHHHLAARAPECSSAAIDPSPSCLVVVLSSMPYGGVHSCTSTAKAPTLRSHPPLAVTDSCESRRTYRLRLHLHLHLLQHVYCVHQTLAKLLHASWVQAIWFQFRLSLHHCYWLWWSRLVLPSL